RAGRASLLATDASDYAYAPAFGPSASGIRTLYLDTAGDLVLANSIGTKLATVTSATGQNDPIGMVSGSRALYETTGTTPTWKIYDALTGTSAAAGVPRLAPAALWGDYLVWINTDGSVDRMDLSTSAEITVLPAQASSGGTCYVNGGGGKGLFVSGDFVAWSEECSTSSGSPTVVAGYVNVTKGGSVQTLNSIPVALSQDYSATIPAGTQMSPGSPQALSAVDLASPNSAISVGESSGSVSLDASVIAWVDQNGIPEASPLGTAIDQPRYLGNGAAPTSYSLTGGGVWNGEWDTSAPLSTCTVTISQNLITVNTLPCDSSAMALGDGVVAWNGTNGSGGTVSPGTYDWSLSASNGSGDVVGIDGSALSLSGSINVTATYTATTTTLTTSTNPTPLGQSVTYKASVTPAPGGGTVTFADNGTDIGTCTAMTLSAAATTGCSQTYTSVATHPISATYNGDSTFSSSASATLDESVPKSTPTVDGGATPKSTSYGDAIDYTATVAGAAGAADPTGTVAISVGSPQWTCRSID
ncbi:MAG: Ig-like domain-containing protein, partial [Acidimicrobiales bacterium]